MQAQPTEMVFPTREEWWASLSHYRRARWRLWHAVGGTPEQLWARRARCFNRDTAKRCQFEGRVSGPELRALVKQHRSRCVYCQRRQEFYGLGFRVRKLWALKVMRRSPRRWVNPEKHGTFDHVVPLVWGGEHNITNLVPACDACNRGRAPNNPIRVAALAVELLEAS